MISSHNSWYTLYLVPESSIDAAICIIISHCSDRFISSIFINTDWSCYSTVWCNSTPHTTHPRQQYNLEHTFELSNNSPYIDGLVQYRCNSNVLAMELRLTCITPPIVAPGARCEVSGATILYTISCVITESHSTDQLKAGFAMAVESGSILPHPGSLVQHITQLVNTF